MKLIAGLVVMVRDIVFRLSLAPRQIVSFELHSFADRKRWDAHARQAEVVRAVIVSCLGMRIGLDGQPVILGDFFDCRVKGSPFRAAHLYLLWYTDWPQRVIVQIEDGLCGELRGMFAQILRAEQPLLFGCNRSKQVGARR